VELPENDDPNIIRHVAIHEASHAVATIVGGLTLNKVHIRPQTLPDGRIRRGLTDAPFSDDDIAGKGESSALPYLIQGLSGPTAERKVNREYREHNGGTNDFELVKRIAVIAICNLADGDQVAITEEQRVRVNALLDFAQKASLRIVEDRWHAILKVAALLQDRKELGGVEVAAIVNNQSGDGFFNPCDIDSILSGT
jgi:hypothetical protein